MDASHLGWMVNWALTNSKFSLPRENVGDVQYTKKGYNKCGKILEYFPRSIRRFNRVKKKCLLPIELYFYCLLLQDWCIKLHILLLARTLRDLDGSPTPHRDIAHAVARGKYKEVLYSWKLVVSPPSSLCSFLNSVIA